MLTAEIFSSYLVARFDPHRDRTRQHPRNLSRHPSEGEDAPWSHARARHDRTRSGTPCDSPLSTDLGDTSWLRVERAGDTVHRLFNTLWITVETRPPLPL